MESVQAADEFSRDICFRATTQTCDCQPFWQQYLYSFLYFKPGQLRRV